MQHVVVGCLDGPGNVIPIVADVELAIFFVAIALTVVMVSGGPVISGPTIIFRDTRTSNT